MSLFQTVRRMWRGGRTRDAPAGGVGFLLSDNWKDLGVLGYTTLADSPEILTACRKIASLIGATTIHLMRNTSDGDERVLDGLARMIDITPAPNLTRNAWMETIVLNLLLYGNGNSIVLPRWNNGYLESLEPVAPARVVLTPAPGSWTDYAAVVDGMPFAPDEILHFTYNPSSLYPWRGRGVSVSLRDAAGNLKQARATEKAFMASEYKPSIIVKVDALTDEFSSAAGRKRLIEEYLKPAAPGAPWLIPANQFDVTQVKPLTLSDLAIEKTVELDRRTVAAVMGVPPFVVGVGQYSAAEWNYFIQSTIMPLCKSIAAEMTRKLLTAPDRYFRFNVWSLLDYDLQKVSAVLLDGSDRGFVNGDEWRDRMHLPPAGLKEYRVLENYIPADKSGDQKKLIQDGGGDG